MEDSEAHRGAPEPYLNGEELPTVMGIGLARRIALMNHSCRPTCEVDYRPSPVKHLFIF